MSTRETFTVPVAVTVDDDEIEGCHGQIPNRRYRPRTGATGAALLVWSHGGAFAWGGLDQLEAHTVAATALRARTRGRHYFTQFTPRLVEKMNLNYACDATALTAAFPAEGHLEGPPPTSMIDADHDTLRASGRAFADQLRGPASTWTTR